MVRLETIVNKLNKEFNIKEYGKDPSFSRFIPHVYENIQFDWKSSFENEFIHLFNGLMIKGEENVGTIYLAVFPTDHVLERFISKGRSGDLLFMHHPLLMECGDPKGKWGKGFIPIKEKYIKQLKEKKLSVYTCHIPMDSHEQLGPNIAIAHELKVDVTDVKDDIQKNNFILYGTIETTNTDNLIATLKSIFNIPYVNFAGPKKHEIKKVAIVAGCGDIVDWMKDAEHNGADAYITGEIHCHIDNEYGRQKYREMKNFIPNTSMSLIAVSHSASEYLVHKTLMKEWFEKKFNIQTVLLPQEKWWL